MCRATLGATPVKRCTVAASSTFSKGLRGTPGWPNTLKRVPLLPNAHDGSSICWVRRSSLTSSRLRPMTASLLRSSSGLLHPEPALAPHVEQRRPEQQRAQGGELVAGADLEQGEAPVEEG